MYNVLLADDEPAITDAMLHEIDWSALELEVVCVARSGRQALEYVISHAVDIVITDIRMGDMDGLSLCKRVNELNRDIQLIIISGFAEFSYARQALTYGAVGYCLKPLEYLELTKYLSVCINRIKEKKGTIDKDAILTALYEGNGQELQRILRALGYYGERYYIGVSAGKSLLKPSGGLYVPLGYRRYGYISTAPIFEESAAQKLIMHQCQGIAYLPQSVFPSAIPGLMRELSDAAYQFFMDKNQRITTELKHGDATAILRDIRHCSYKGDKKQMVSALQRFRETDKSNYTIREAWQLYSILASSEKFNQIAAGSDVNNAEQMVQQYQSFNNMLDAFIEQIQQGAEQQEVQNDSNLLFLRIVKYADQNLSGCCSLATFAEELGMNANYLGQVFKRETGKTFTTYVTDMRIERAKEMLMTGSVSIGSIADAVGFNDYFYFLKTFKRVTGTTPKQYLRENREFLPEENAEEND